MVGPDGYVQYVMQVQVQETDFSGLTGRLACNSPVNESVQQNKRSDKDYIDHNGTHKFEAGCVTLA